MNPTTDMPRGLRIAAAWLDQIRAASYGIPPYQPTIDRVVSMCHSSEPCNDCGAPVGTAHREDCDVARCLHNGRQRIQCDGGICDEDCDTTDPYGRAQHEAFHGEGPHECGLELWDGVWPGYEECVELGLYCFFPGLGVGYIPCGPEHPEAMPDLNRLPRATVWDRDRQRRVARDGKAEQGAGQ